MIIDNEPECKEAMVRLGSKVFEAMNPGTDSSRRPNGCFYDDFDVPNPPKISFNSELNSSRVMPPFVQPIGYGYGGVCHSRGKIIISQITTM